MRKYLLIIALLFLMLLHGHLASATIADLEPTRLGQCKQIVQIDTQANSETLTFILRGDGTIENIQKAMTALGNHSFNYTYCNTNISGAYYANGIGDYTGSEWNYKFEVNLQGKKYETVDGIVYLIAFAFLVAVGIFAILSFNALPFDDTRNNENRIIAISWKKYLKIFIGCMIYVLFIAMNYFAWNISVGILQFEELGKFFKFMFRTSYVLMYPIFVVIVIISVAQFIKDKKAEGFLTRNLTLR